MSKAEPRQVDMAGVSTSGRRIHVPPGDYLLKGRSVEFTESKSSGNPMWVWTWEFVNGPKKGQTIIDRTVLIKNSLFRLRNLLEAVGFDVPDSKLNVDPNKILKRTQKQPVGAEVVDDDAYEGHIPSTIKRYVSADEVSDPPEGDDEDDELDEDDLASDLDEFEEELDEDLEDEEDEEDEEELEGYTEEELEEMSRKEILKLAKELGITRVKGKRTNTYISEILAVQEGEVEDDEDEDLDEADDEETSSDTVDELEDFDLDDLE